MSISTEKELHYILQILKTRRMLTEVLLEVTDALLQDVASEVHKKARSKGRNFLSKTYRFLQNYYTFVVFIYSVEMHAALYCHCTLKTMEIYYNDLWENILLFYLT